MARSRLHSLSKGGRGFGEGDAAGGEVFKGLLSERGGRKAREARKGGRGGRRGQILDSIDIARQSPFETIAGRRVEPFAIGFVPAVERFGHSLHPFRDGGVPDAD